MADYKTTQQYAPLVAPKTWGAEEKKFLVQLTDILDDIYRRYGRLRFEDLGSTLRTRISSTESILLEVGAERVFIAATEVALLADLAAMTPPVPLAVNLLWYDTTNKLFKRVTAVGPPAVWETLQTNEMHTSFIDIAGDHINIASGGALNITSPTTIAIFAGTGASAIGITNDTYLMYAGDSNPVNAPFSVTMTGVLKALTGIFSGTFTITNPNNTQEKIVIGDNGAGEFGCYITRNNGSTFLRLFDFNGLDGTAIIPGTFDANAPQFTYTGEYISISDGDGNWRIKFLTSGTFVPLTAMTVDLFLVGGGGGGSASGGGGGGGGYTLTHANITLTKDAEYPVVIGDGGTDETDGDASTMCGYTANGGEAAKSDDNSGQDGGDGGSGGGAAALYLAGDGGEDGGDGEDSAYADGGPGQGTTTREFGTGDKYGGGGGAAINDALEAPPDTLDISQIEQWQYSWLYDSIGSSWYNVGEDNTSYMRRTSYPSNQYNNIYRLQFKVPGNALAAGAVISSVKLKLYSQQGVVNTSTTTEVMVTGTYRKTTGLSFTNKGTIDGTGLKEIDITTLCTAINKANDWYIQLQLALASGVTLDEMTYHTLLSGEYAPYIEITYNTTQTPGDGKNGGGNGAGPGRAATSGTPNTGGGAGGGNAEVIGGSGIAIIRNHIA